MLHQHVFKLYVEYVWLATMAPRPSTCPFPTQGSALSAMSPGLSTSKPQLRTCPHKLWLLLTTELDY